MNRVAVALGAVGLCLGGWGAAQAQKGVDVDPSQLPFHVSLPPGFHVEKTLGPDFDVYYFERGDRTYAGAYVGFAPSFPVKYRGTGADRQPDGRVQQLVSCSGGQPVKREVLFVVRPNYLVHTWTIDVGPSERGKAEDILLSIGFSGWERPLTRAALEPCPS